jgi:hypothetical protein
VRVVLHHASGSVIHTKPPASIAAECGLHVHLVEDLSAVEPVTPGGASLLVGGAQENSTAEPGASHLLHRGDPAEKRAPHALPSFAWQHDVGLLI